LEKKGRLGLPKWRLSNRVYHSLEGRRHTEVDMRSTQVSQQTRRRGNVAGQVSLATIPAAGGGVPKGDKPSRQDAQPSTRNRCDSATILVLAKKREPECGAIKMTRV